MQHSCRYGFRVAVADVLRSGRKQLEGDGRGHGCLGGCFHADVCCVETAEEVEKERADANDGLHDKECGGIES